MTASSWSQKHGPWIGWAVFALCVAGWCIGRSLNRAGLACDVLIAIALAAQVWLLLIQRDNRI